MIYQDFYDAYAGIQNPDIISSIRQAAIYKLSGMSKEEILQNIGVQVLNRNEDATLLSAMGHRLLGETAIVPVVNLTQDETYVAAYVDDKLRRQIGGDLPNNDVLIDIGLKNDEKRDRIFLTNMMAAFAGEEDTVDLNTLSAVMSGRRMASRALYSEDFRKKLQEIYPEGCYIIPSSKEELFLCPKDLVSREDLNQSIAEINADPTTVPPDKVLAQSVFYFDGTAIRPDRDYLKHLNCPVYPDEPVYQARYGPTAGIEVPNGKVPGPDVSLPKEALQKDNGIPFMDNRGLEDALTIAGKNKPASKKEAKAPEKKESKKKRPKAR